ncbi:MAG: hypothetical protein K8S16_01820 [Bacteroidales bacterium]|nr:hypothetical protein [Bacteroidales bacterium]
MKVKHILAIFLLGVIGATIGVFFKIQHWPGAGFILVVSLSLEVLSGILAIWKLLTIKKFKDFLNS